MNLSALKHSSPTAVTRYDVPRYLVTLLSGSDAYVQQAAYLVLGMIPRTGTWYDIWYLILVSTYDQTQSVGDMEIMFVRGASLQPLLPENYKIVHRVQQAVQRQQSDLLAAAVYLL